MAEDQVNRKRNETHKQKTSFLADRANRRVQAWLHDQVPGADGMPVQRSVSSLALQDRSSFDNPMPMVNFQADQMLVGLYRSNNPNLHSFRPSAAKISTL